MMATRQKVHAEERHSRWDFRRPPVHFEPKNTRDKCRRARVGPGISIFCRNVPRILTIFVWLFGLSGQALRSEEVAGDFISIFNGRDLSGWDGKPGCWVVADGAIKSVGTSKNWLIWRGGEVADFELRLRFRFTKGNSGVQVRSLDKGDWQVHGYQVEIASEKEMGLWHESLWKVQERRFLALAGQSVLISADGSKSVERFSPASTVQASYNVKDWNDLVVIGRGPELIQMINGVVYSKLTDHHASFSRRSGVIALQDHGAGCVVEFKDIRLKRISSP